MGLIHLYDNHYRQTHYDIKITTLSSSLGSGHFPNRPIIYFFASGKTWHASYYILLPLLQMLAVANRRLLYLLMAKNSRSDTYERK